MKPIVFKKTSFLPSLPLTSSEKRVLGFLVLLALLGGATLALENRLGPWFFESPIYSTRIVDIPEKTFYRQPRKNHSSPVELDVNQTGAAQLRWVPGIGPATAQAIVLYREDHGPFQDLSSLKLVPGISEKKFNKMKSHLVLSESHSSRERGTF
jgi:competence ComEA-like helix-hairpin-helix protein